MALNFVTPEIDADLHCFFSAMNYVTTLGNSQKRLELKVSISDRIQSKMDTFPYPVLNINITFFFLALVLKIFTFFELKRSEKIMLKPKSKILCIKVI